MAYFWKENCSKSQLSLIQKQQTNFKLHGNDSTQSSEPLVSRLHSYPYSRQNLGTGVAELCSPPARLSTSQISGFATRRPDSHHRGGTLKWLFMCILTVLSILRLIPIQVPIIWLPAGHCETGNPVVFRMPPARNSRSQIEKKINAFFFNCYSSFSVNI